MVLSIIIVNWNGRQMTENCIDSILGSSRDKIDNLEYEIIVIDNGSNDGSPDLLKSEKHPVKTILNEENTGYASASNQGMKAAEGKYILLLGNDTLIKRDALEKCISFLEENSNCGATGCRLLNPDGSIQNNCKKFPRLRNAFFTYLSLDKLNRDYDMDWFKYDKTREVEQISTTFLMIRKSLLDKIGYFDEDYRILYNDVDLCKRIWQAGSRICFLSTAEVTHFGSRSTGKAGFNLRRIMYKDIYRYYRRNFGIIAITLIPILTMRLLLKTATRR